MKKKSMALAIGTVLLAAVPVFSVVAKVAPLSKHKVTLKNLTVDSIDSDARTITATDGGLNVAIQQYTTYTIIVDSKMKIRRASGEKADFSEISEEDSITVSGTTTDGTIIKATKVTDNSIRKIRGAYRAIVLATSVGPGNQEFSVVLKDNEGVHFVFIYSYTKIREGKNRRSFDDLQAGDRISISGIEHIDGFPLIYNTTLIKITGHDAPLPLN